MLSESNAEQDTSPGKDDQLTDSALPITTHYSVGACVQPGPQRLGVEGQGSSFSTFGAGSVGFWDRGSASKTRGNGRHKCGNHTFLKVMP